MTYTLNESTMFTPSSRKDWHMWLENNYTVKDEIWLVYYKKHTGKPTLSYNDSVEEALCFGWIDGIKKSIDDERYCHRFTPRSNKSRWSETNVKRAKELISKGLMKAEGLRQYEDAIRNPDRLIVKAKKKTPAEMPGDLKEALKKKGDAFPYFLSLPLSYRNMCILWINNAKREETRLKRITELVETSSKGIKTGMK